MVEITERNIITQLGKWRCECVEVYLSFFQIWEMLYLVWTTSSSVPTRRCGVITGVTIGLSWPTSTSKIVTATEIFAFGFIFVELFLCFLVPFKFPVDVWMLFPDWVVRPSVWNGSNSDWAVAASTWRNRQGRRKALGVEVRRRPREQVFTLTRFICSCGRRNKPCFSLTSILVGKLAH